MPAVPAFERQKQEDYYKLKVNLSHTEKCYPQNTKTGLRRRLSQ